MTASMLEKVRGAIGPAADRPVACAYWVPGRIEVLGKHTDYAGGRSLLCAVEQGFVAAAVPRADAEVRVFDVAAGARADLRLDPALPQPPDAWARYPATVVRRVARNFPGARRGADIGFASSLPLASGMSSSSAFMVAVFLVLAEVNGLQADEAYRESVRTPEDLAGYLATVENGRSFRGLTGDRGVGTFGGSEDHTAMLCCRAGELSQYSFCPVRHERQVTCPPGHAFVVAVSGVKAEKTGAAKDSYNRASLAVRAILDAWRAATGRPDGSLADAVAGGGAADVREVLARASVDGFETGALLDRLDQFVEESGQIVPAAGDALQRGDLSRFGALVDRSQDLAARLLGNQVPETIELARRARELGASAASAFGAGFGGSVWALVSRADLESFVAKWEASYRSSFPSVRPTFLVTLPGPSAHRL